ncbi:MULTISPECIES: hypothetical protein [Terrisporobacter]|uniref:hypothetical protein n=1 Tax=Terrisporobacter TaxID=1505652 RepID=UPI0023F1C558|nr:MULTISPECIES: hypothetical protein [Terrisporobacter]
MQVPYMDKHTYIPFSEYLESCKRSNQSNYDIASEEEVLKEMEEVMKQFEGR